MIKKLELTGRDIYENTAIAKLNELVDVVNALVKENNLHEMQIDELQMKAEPYAEQRKWIGKLCKFRDYPACEWRYGILYKIYEDNDYPFWDTDCNEYRECEPVKPDDDIIFKGE